MIMSPLHLVTIKPYYYQKI